jgi:hypothetical protein
VMVDAATQARELVRIVRGDAGLPGAVRRQAGALASLATANPDLAIERLEALRVAALPSLPMVPPAVDYARCVAIEVFWRYNLDPRVKELFVAPEDYRRSIESSPEPEVRLESDLGPQSIAPAANSWLVPSARLDGVSAADMRIQLNFDQPPPYVVMAFSVARMFAAGVEVRVPTGIDAIPSRLTQWFRENVPDERIDRDIPRAALERIEWRP